MGVNAPETNKSIYNLILKWNGFSARRERLYSIVTLTKLVLHNADFELS